jgi:DinB superfamily
VATPIGTPRPPIGSVNLVERCAECGFVYELARANAAGAAIVKSSAEMGRLVTDPNAEVRSRPEPATWSPLEYACHVRDVLIVQRERVLLARRRRVPTLEPMGRDERVDHDGYAEQVPEEVARQLADAAQLFANVLARLEADDWQRTVIYNYPTPTERALAWVAVHTLHELEHHTLDIRRQLVAESHRP